MVRLLFRSLSLKEAGQTLFQIADGGSCVGGGVGFHVNAIMMKNKKVKTTTMKDKKKTRGQLVSNILSNFFSHVNSV